MNESSKSQLSAKSHAELLKIKTNTQTAIDKKLVPEKEIAEAKETVEFITGLLAKPENRVVKSGMVKVRANEPINEDGHHDKGDEFDVAESRLPALGKLVTRVACLLALFALFLLGTKSAHAADPSQYDGSTALAYVTNVIPAGASWTNSLTSTNGVITATKFGKIGLLITHQCTGANGTNSPTGGIYRFAKGRDASNTNSWETTPSVLVTNAYNGTNFNSAYTEVSMGPAGYLRLVDIIGGATNTGGIMTNIAIYPIKKPGQ